MITPKLKDTCWSRTLITSNYIKPQIGTAGLARTIEPLGNKPYFYICLLQLLISVDLGITIVMLTPTVPIPKDRSIARAIRDTQEMESRVLVSFGYEISSLN